VDLEACTWSCSCLHSTFTRAAACPAICSNKLAVMPALSYTTCNTFTYSSNSITLT
jgi:hypothetical protein